MKWKFFQEHLATEAIQSLLADCPGKDRRCAKQGPNVLVSCVPGEEHSLIPCPGCLSGIQGLSVKNLGRSLPSVRFCARLWPFHPMRSF